MAPAHELPNDKSNSASPKNSGRLKKRQTKNFEVRPATAAAADDDAWHKPQRQDQSPQHRSTCPSVPPADSQICTASHISVVIFAVLPVLRMPEKKAPCASVCVPDTSAAAAPFAISHSCLSLRYSRLPLPPSTSLSVSVSVLGSGISAGNAAAAATATNNFDIALLSCGTFHCHSQAKLSLQCSGQDVQGYCEINVMAEH